MRSTEEGAAAGHGPRRGGWTSRRRKGEIRGHGIQNLGNLWKMPCMKPSRGKSAEMEQEQTPSDPGASREEGEYIKPGKGSLPTLPLAGFNRREWDQKAKITTSERGIAGKKFELKGAQEKREKSQFTEKKRGGGMTYITIVLNTWGSDRGFKEDCWEGGNFEMRSCNALESGRGLKLDPCVAAGGGRKFKEKARAKDSIKLTKGKEGKVPIPQAGNRVEKKDCAPEKKTNPRNLRKSAKGREVIGKFEPTAYFAQTSAVSDRVQLKGRNAKRKRSERRGKPKHC